MLKIATKLKSENDLDLIKSITTPKITQIASVKGNNFSGSVLTSPLPKKFIPNFSSEAKGYDIQPYKLIDQIKNNDTYNGQQSTKTRDLSLGSSQVKGFQLNEIDNNKNLELQGLAILNPIASKANSVTDIQQEPLSLKRGSSVESSIQTNGIKLKEYSTNQLFLKTFQNKNGLSSSQRVSTIQNILSNSNLDNNNSICQSEQQNSVLPIHLIQERTSHKIQVLNQINIKSFAISDEFKLIFT